MIYDINYKFFWTSLMNPILRKTKQIAWGAVLLKPLQKLRNLIFEDYANGTTALKWLGGTAYIKGNRVIYKNRIVYECILAHSNHAPPNPTYWIQVLDNYIGVRERARYSSQKILFEYALNRWFQSTGIYITNNPISLGSFLLANSSELSGQMPNDSRFQVNYLSNNYTPPSQYDFTIYVPSAVYNALATTNTQRTNIVRAFADKYRLAGMNYNVIPF